MRVSKKGRISALFTAALLIFATATTHSSFASGTLADAASAGDLDQARELLNSGADVNLPQPDGTTALLWAVYNSSMDLVPLLLDAGADPNVANDLHITPLIQASRYGNTEMITALLASGATLTGPGNGVESPLMAAARAGNPEAVKVLLDAGANPNATEVIDNQTALMWATAEGHHEVVEVLLEAGADPNMKSRVSELTKRSSNADFTTGGFAAMHWAGRNGDIPMVELLLKYGADINIKNGDGSTAMMLAIVNDRFDIAAQLLDLKADPNDGSLFYITEMRDATTDWRARDGTVFRADHDNTLSALDLTELLLDAGADPNLAVDMQMHNASMCCDTNVDSTPFYRAAVAADVAGMKLMIARGVDTEWTPTPEPPPDKEPDFPQPRGNEGKTALMVAIKGGKGVGVAGGPNDLRYGKPDFREAGDRDPFEAVKLLLDAGADVNAVGLIQETALHIAIDALHPGIVRALVENGADLYAENKEGLNALELAEAKEAPEPRPGFYFEPPLAQPEEMVALLLELGAVPREKEQGDSAQ